ncbi:MAG: hypothetical protein IH943_01360 [Acidobacteria bacterium]|nr:hypothetical protein [Acidobacteriota bacterium]
MRRSHNAAVATLVVLAMVAGACSGSGSEPPSASKLETNFDVTPQANAVILDESLVEDLLVSSDPDAGEYRFRGSKDDIGSPEIGQAVALGGAGFGIVSSVLEEGGETVLQLSEATLGDIVDTGTLEWDYDVSWADFEFTFEETAGLSGPVFAAMAPVVAQTSQKTTIEFTHQGWKFTIELEPKDERLNFKLVGSLSIGTSPAQASISGQGWVSGFNYSSTLEYEGGSPVDMTTDINGLQGEIELKWAAFRTPQQAITEIVKFNAPLSLPIPIPGPYGIPMALQLKVAGRIVPELSALESSSGGSWKVKYSSDQGFKVESDGVGLPQGVLKSDAIDTSGDTVTAGLGPAGFGLGVEFPRFELGFVGYSPFAFITIDTYSTSLWTPGTTLTADIPPCQYGYTKFSAIAGYQLKVLGWASLTDQYTLWEKQVDKYLDGKECTLSGD